MAKTPGEIQKELDDERTKSAENIKALQQKLTEKDQVLKKAMADIEELQKRGNQDSEADKKIEQLTIVIGELKKEMGIMSAEKQKEGLAKQYPDILPELLLGKTPEEQAIIVTKQREITKKNYDEKPSAHAPVYKSVNEIDDEIRKVQEDQSLSIPDKMTKVRELKSKKDEI